jgi:hypothetical protein
MDAKTQKLNANTRIKIIEELFSSEASKQFNVERFLDGLKEACSNNRWLLH